MLRLGAAQVKQVVHRAPNENPSRAPAMPDATPQLVYMTCRAFMRRSADLTGGRRASLRSSARTCARRRRCPIRRPGFRPCSLLASPFVSARLWARGSCCFLVPTPNEGWRSAGGAHCLLSRWRGATTALATRGASRCDRDGATRRSTVAISGRGTTLQLRQCPPDPRCDLPAGPIARPGRLGPVPPAPQFATVGHGTPRPAPSVDRLRRRPS